MKDTDSSRLDQGVPNQNEVNGRATGALFFVGFGALWLLLGLLGQGHQRTAVWLVPLVLLAGLSPILWMYRRSTSLPPGTVPPEEAERVKRLFNAVNIVQWVSVVAAVLILGILHHPEYVAPAIAVIVGLHLFPLASAFHYPQHYATGALLIVWSLGCMLCLRASVLPGICSEGTAAILLLSAAATLFRCYALLREHPQAHQPLAGTSSTI